MNAVYVNAVYVNAVYMNAVLDIDAVSISVFPDVFILLCPTY
jgi:hypothetical protein